MKQPLALCEFLTNGTVFPVSLGIPSETDAASALRWQKIGPGGQGDWRIVDAVSLQKLLTENRVDLSCFTSEAAASKRDFIASLGEKGTP